jgi:SAM-dependent methyltransferase
MAGPQPKDLQREWEDSPLRDAWPVGPDNAYIIARIARVVQEATAAGARGPVLEVAAAEALHSCRLSGRGLGVVALDPSWPMLERARANMAETGTRFALVRGIAETLPFPDATFDRVLCDSAVDHLADPARGIGEMARVLRPDGRLVVSFVNYGSLTVRTSRALYAVSRALRLPWSRGHLFWDTPVPQEHTFECTYGRIAWLCRPWLELERAFGVSLGWQLPGWGRLLGRVRWSRAERVLWALDRVAWRMPRFADYLVTVWRPKRPA